MPPPRPRITVRRLMIAVALIALGMGVGRVAWLGITYRRRADWHAVRHEIARDRVVWAERMVGRGYLAPGAKLAAESEADYHAALGRKYEHAAARPWLPVEPDPPGPR